MSRITRWAFQNKAGIVVMVVLSLLMGIVSYFSLPMELLPSADAPMIMVTTLGQSLDANSMASSVTEPIEKAVGTVKGKSSVLSTTGDGYSQLTISFDAGSDMKQAKSDIQDALGTLQLPEGVLKPNVVQLNTSMIPVADVGISFKDGITQANLDRVANDIVPLFQKIKGVGSVQIFGQNTRQVVVHLDTKKMADMHLPVQAVTGILQGKNMSVAIGDHTLDNQAATFKVVGALSDLQSLQGLPVGPQVKLGDIASVEAVQDTQSLTQLNGKDSVIIVVTKDASSNAVTIGKGVQSTVDQVNHDFNPDIQSTLVFATANMVVNSVNSMIREVLMGALFATIVILLFIRSIKTTFIAVISIPLSLCLTLYLLSQSGVTLNILTLGGVAVAVGRLVDDSIVVIENIFRRAQKEGYSKEMVYESVREVATAITSSTLTTVAVFLPMGLVKGMHELILPFALTVTYSLLSSLLVALAVVPLMSYGLLKNTKSHAYKSPRTYLKLLAWSLNHKWIPLTLAALAFVGSIAIYAVLPKGALDVKDSSMVNVTLAYPADTPYSTVNQGAMQLEQFITDQPEIQNVYLQLGNSQQQAQYGQVTSPTTATYQLFLKDHADANHLIDQVNSQKQQYGKATLQVAAASGWGQSSPGITIDLLGNNPADLQTAAASVMDAVKGISGVTKVSTNEQAKKPVYQITVDPNQDSAQDVAMQLRMLLNQTPIGTMKLDGKDTAVVLDATENPSSQADLSNLQITTKSGSLPLSSVAKIQKVDQTSSVLRKDGHDFIRLTAEVDSSKLSVINQSIQKNTAALQLPKGVTLDIGGAALQQNSDFTQLGQTMLASIGIVYLIMVLTFRTMRTPLAILFSLPLAAIGAIIGLIVTNTSVDASTLIGGLMLIGIVVTNAIVLLDRVKQNEKSMIIRDALLEAGSVRMRPILMTAVATICAMLPLVFSKTEAGSIVGKSLAVVVIGGLAIATLLTLVIIPVIYELLHFKKSKRQRLEAAQK